MKYFYLLFGLFTLSFFSAQAQKYDTLVIDKMIIGTVADGAKVATKLSDKCGLLASSDYSPIHKATGNIALVTDYILCNNGTANMFFEIYDGTSFKIIADKDLKFSEDQDSDQIKVQLASRSKSDKDLVHTNIGMMADFVKDYGNREERKQLHAEMGDALQPFLATEKYGIGFVNFHATEGYSSTGAYFKIYNSGKKTIKYIWITVAGENAVNDLVKTTSGGYYKTLKGIGPVEPDAMASWEFDYVWFTDIVEYLRISTIKIQYMDGTFRTVKYNEDMYIGNDAYNRFMEIDAKIPTTEVSE